MSMKLASRQGDGTADHTLAISDLEKIVGPQNSEMKSVVSANRMLAYVSGVNEARDSPERRDSGPYFGNL